MNLLSSSASSAILFGALIAEFLILFYARNIGELLEIMDHPDSVRKHHSRVTPLVGGLAIMIPLLSWIGAILVSGHSGNEKLALAILLCGAGATLVGYADDQSSTSPSSCLLSLFLLTAFALVIAPELLPTHLNWGNFEPLALAPWMAYGLIAVAMAGFVNAVNMADGQNGIVTGMFVVWSVCLMTVTGGLTQNVSQVLFETSLIAFLFNMVGRAFLGDAGTYGVTFVFGLLAIRAHNGWGVSAETIAVWFFIPIMDCLRLIFTRALQGVAPSDGDRNHFHHRLQDRVGKTYGLLIYLGAVGTSSLIASLMPRLSIVCLLLLTAFYLSLALINSEKAVELREVEVARDGEQFRLAANSNVVLLEAQESNLDGH